MLLQKIHLEQMAVGALPHGFWAMGVIVTMESVPVLDGNLMWEEEKVGASVQIMAAVLMAVQAGGRQYNRTAALGGLIKGTRY